MGLNLEMVLSYTVLNAVSTYIIYSFMNTFLVKQRWHQGIVITSFILYFLSIAGVYLLWRQPILTLLTNIVLFCLLTFNYEAHWRQRLMAVGLILATLFTAEVLSIGLVAIFKEVYFTDYSISEYTLAKIGEQTILMFFYKAYTIMTVAKPERALTIFDWWSLILMPMTIIIPCYLLVGVFLPMAVSREQRLALYGCIGFIFLFNILMYIAYDKLNQLTQEKYEKDLLQQKTKIYEKQIEMQKHTNEHIRIIKHDMKHHLVAIKRLLKNKDYDKLEKYIQLSDDFLREGQINTIFTPCQSLNDIVNAKAYEAAQQGITIACDVNVKRPLQITMFDLNMVLGNLLDNAMEALMPMSDERKTIDLSITLEANLLHIIVANPYQKDGLNINSGILKSTKKDHIAHGYGLKSVKKIVGKYRGDYQVSLSDTQFKVTIVMCD